MGRLDQNNKIQGHVSVGYKETDFIETAIRYKLLHTTNRPTIVFEKASDFFSDAVNSYRNQFVNMFVYSKHLYIHNMIETSNGIFDVYVMILYIIGYINDYPEIIKFFDWFIQTSKNFGSTDVAFYIYEDIGKYKKLIPILRENVHTLFDLSHTTNPAYKVNAI